MAQRWSAGLVVAVLACGGDDDDAAGPTDAAADAAEDGGTAPTDAAPDAAPDAAAATHVIVDETAGSLELPFTFDAEGSGTDRVGAIEVSGGLAAIEVDGEAWIGVAYEHQDWSAFGYDTFQVLLVAPDHWVVLWIYCQGSELTDLYFEVSDGSPLAYEPASGACTLVDEPDTVDVALPAVDMHVDQLVAGYRVLGDDLQIDGPAPGALRLGPTEMHVLAFRDVDCSAECGAPGWYELHAVLWDPVGSRACFGIFYLFLDDQPVLLTYSLTLPDLTDPAGETQLDATWDLVGG